MDCLWTLSFLTLLLDSASGQASVTSTKAIPLPTSRPADAFNVPANFPSVGFETAFLDGYNNEFSSNLIESLASRMSEPPIIRIGGTSGDIITINPAQSEPAKCVAEPCNSAAEFVLGSSYFDALSKQFKSARFSIQAPLTDGNPNTTNIVEYITRAAAAINDTSRIDAIALGNEVNFYEPNGPSYVSDAQDAKDAIDSIDSLPAFSDRIWEVADTASAHASTGKAPYTIQGLFDDGIDNDKKVKYVAEHYYQFDGKTPGIERHLLNHTALRDKLSNYAKSITYTRQSTNAKFILSETGGPLGVTDPRQALFANTLWMVNFNLYAMSLGVSRVTGVQRPEAKRSLWIPTEGLSVPGPRVQAPFYALPFVADFVGKDGEGDRGVVNVGLGSEVLSCYAMFEGGGLARVAVVNLRAYGGQGQREAVKVQLKDLGSVEKVEVGRLHADAGIAAGGFDVNGENITWSGEQWSFQVNKGKGNGDLKRKTLEVQGGVVDVVIPDSEAIIVYL